MASSATIRPAGALLIGAGVAMVVTLGLAAESASAAVCCEPRATGDAARGSRQQVEQWLARVTDMARQWQRPNSWRPGGGAAIVSRPTRAEMLPEPATVSRPHPPRRAATRDLPRAALIDLPPPMAV